MFTLPGPEALPRSAARDFIEQCLVKHRSGLVFDGRAYRRDDPFCAGLYQAGGDAGPFVADACASAVTGEQYADGRHPGLSQGRDGDGIQVAFGVGEQDGAARGVEVVPWTHMRSQCEQLRLRSPAERRSARRRLLVLAEPAGTRQVDSTQLAQVTKRIDDENGRAFGGATRDALTA